MRSAFLPPRLVRLASWGLVWLVGGLAAGLSLSAMAQPTEARKEAALKADLHSSTRPALSAPAARSALRARESMTWMSKNADTPPPPRTTVPPSTDSSSEDPARIWSVELGDNTVRLCLKRWAKEAQWQLVWDADRDFVIDAEVQWYGTFEQALTALLESLKNSEFPLQARVNTASRVLRIQRLSPSSER